MLKSEFAPAKINLTLEILGRRTDGYHEIRSLVAFAQDVGDLLTLQSAAHSATVTTGTFAIAISGDNLVDKAVAAVHRVLPNFEPGQLALEKTLPVGSGIGGGSADAAAALRLLAGAYPEVAALDLHAIAQKLGADVPVCLRGRAVIMTGTGEHLEVVSLPHDVYAVLANPLVSVPENKTARVFALLAAEALPGEPLKDRTPPLATPGDVVTYAKQWGNGLDAPAREIFPVLDLVLDELRRLDGCRLAQLSGAGPTCFALFTTMREALAGAAKLQERQPGWWVRATRLA